MGLATTISWLAVLFNPPQTRRRAVLFSLLQTRRRMASLLQSAMRPRQFKQGTHLGPTAI